jgi:hypothetical protein
VCVCVCVYRSDLRFDWRIEVRVVTAEVLCVARGVWMRCCCENERLIEVYTDRDRHRERSELLCVCARVRYRVGLGGGLVDVDVSEGGLRAVHMCVSVCAYVRRYLCFIFVGMRVCKYVCMQAYTRVCMQWGRGRQGGRNGSREGQHARDRLGLSVRD